LGRRSRPKATARFELFIWLCVHAERTSGRLLVTAAALAQTLHTSEAQITHGLEELVPAGVAMFGVGIDGAIYVRSLAKFQ
jgi:hypothetical protein